jgi:hypothetical protein
VDLQSPFLTRDELKRLVSSPNRKTQINWLDANCVPYFVDVTGSPVVSREFVLSRLNGLQLRNAKPNGSNQPNFAWMSA